MLPTGQPGRRPTRRHRERSTTVQWVCDLLNTELMNGGFPDDVLPSEDALIKKYAVSRGVVRQVLLVLQEQGVIERVRGAGTFLMTPSSWHHTITESRDLSQEVNARGTRAIIRKTHVSRHPATAYVADQLEVAHGSDVVILETSTTLDGFPLGIRTAFMPFDRFAVLVDDPRIDLDRSPYEIIPDVLGVPVGETELTIRSSPASSIVAEALLVAVGSPLLDTTRVIRGRQGCPLEYSISHARGDRITFSTVMRVPPGSDPSTAP